MKIINFPSRQTNIVEVLTQALEDAKAGRYDTVIMCLSSPQGSDTIWSEQTNAVMTFGSMQIQMRVLEQLKTQCDCVDS